MPEATPKAIATVTVSDAINLGSNWSEITAVAMSPGEHPACPAGRLFFASSNVVLATTLDGDVEPLAANPWTAPFNETFEPYLVRDNHLVKLKNGDLLHTFIGGTWNDNLSPHPYWWNWTIEYPAKNKARAGARAMAWVFRSKDGGATWSPLPGIDAAKLVIPSPPTGEPVKGLGGVPRRWSKKCDGNKCASLGGWDGHLVYADPFNGDVYLATDCQHGTMEIDKHKMIGLLLISRDNGASWSVRGYLDGVHCFRAPVTSLPNTVAFAYPRRVGDNTEIRLATFDPSAVNIELFFDSVVVRQLTPAEETATTKTQYNTNVWRFRSMARHSAGFLLSIPICEKGLYTLGVFNVPENGTQSQLIETIRAPKKGSLAGYTMGDALHGTFIQGLIDDNVNVFYWVESEDSSATSFFKVKFQVYLGTHPLLSTPGTLTLKNGQPYTFPYTATFVGDYLGGCVYRGVDGSRKFVATWSEGGKLHFNTISVSFLPIHFKQTAAVPKSTVEFRPPKRIPIPPQPIQIRSEAPEHEPG